MPLMFRNKKQFGGGTCERLSSLTLVTKVLLYVTIFKGDFLLRYTFRYK